MSNARELALLEKWADVATTPTPTPSPTSPKATKFCCCPNRRRYNLKPSKKSTLHARNIFIDNNFSYIDDVSHETESNNCRTANNNDDDNNGTAAVDKARIGVYAGDDNDADDDDDRHNNEQSSLAATIKRYEDIGDSSRIGNVANNTGNCAEESLMNSTRSRIRRQRRSCSDEGESWRHDKSCHNNTSNSNSNSNNCNGKANINNNSGSSDKEDYDDCNSYSCSCSKESATKPTATTATTTRTTAQQQIQEKSHTISAAIANEAKTIQNNCAVTNATQSGNDNVAAHSVRHQQQQQQQQQRQQRQQQQPHDKINDDDDETFEDYKNDDNTNECRSNRSDQQHIQRLSNSKLNLNNKENNISNTNTNGNSRCNSCVDSSSTTAIHSNNNNNNSHYHHHNNKHSNNSCFNNRRCNYCQLQEPQTNNSSGDHSNCNNNKIDLQNKMTITTTNVASRKRSECGLTTTLPAATTATAAAGTATTTAAATAAMPTSPTTASATATARPTTPSLTTVIRTTMTKRSPPNESITGNTTAATSATPTTTTTTTTTVATHKGTLENVRLQAGSNVGSQQNNNCDESSRVPTRCSVRERIAAFAAGNEQAKNHDNSIKSKSQCNKNAASNMTATAATTTTTSQVKSAINSLHHKPPPPPIVVISGNSNGNKCPTSTTTAAAAAAAITATTTTATTFITSHAATPTTTAAVAVAAASPSSATPQNSTVDIPLRHESGLNDEQRASLSATNTTTTTTTTTTTANMLSTTSPLANTGCATMPRRRSPALAANERGVSSSNNSHGSNGCTGDKYGSNSPAAAMTVAVDKKFLSRGAHKPLSGGCDKEATATATAAAAAVATSTTTQSRKLAALDNLDLALSLDMTDEDGEDPYFALQEYLERVKHEINEVFELHKARQRIQQQQEQEQQQQQQFQLENSEATEAAATNDELSRSTESDSGFDSASGGRIGSSGGGSGNGNRISSSNNSNKLPTRATATATDGTTPARRVTEISCQRDINGHTTAATAEEQAPSPSPTTTKLKALPPPPLSPSSTMQNSDFSHNAATELKRLRQQLQAKAAMEADDAANTNASDSATDDVNIWANKFLRDLDNLMSSDKPCNSGSSNNHNNHTSSSAASSPTSTTSPMLLSAAATAAIQSRYGKMAHERCGDQTSATNGLVLRPEKHTTIPLQSFNLDCGRLDSSNNNTSSSSSSDNSNIAAKSNVAYLRTLSAPTPYHQQQQQLQQCQYQHQQQNDNKSACIAIGKGNRNSLATFNASTEQQHHQQQQQQQQQQHHNLTNFQSNDAATNAPATATTTTTTSKTTTTILKIEETVAAAAALAAAAAAAAAASGRQPTVSVNRTDAQDADEESLKSRRQRQLENDMETIRNALLSQSQQLAAMEANSNSSSNSSDKNMLVASATATSIPKQERINHATAATIATAHSKAIQPTSSASLSPPSTLLTPSKANVGGTSSTTTTSYLLNGSDVTKKGSTSTIWTSEESILRSVGAVDEDNNSTSSSACEEASGVMSSGKSGISLDSSGLDNDNNESGIGTATPPKDMSFWKSMHHNHNNNDNESISSLEALRKMKFQKGSSVASSDDPDLLEVLSLCDEPHGGDGTIMGHDEDVDESRDDSGEHQQRHSQKQHQLQQQQRQSRHRLRGRQLDNDESNGAVQLNGDEKYDEENDVVDDDDEEEEEEEDDDEDDEGHDEFETVPYCDCDCTDGDASSASGSGGGGGGGGARKTSSSSIGGGPALAYDAINNVVLRRKYTATPIMVPYANGGSGGGGGGRVQKCRSHSLDTSSLPTSYHNHYHNHQHQHHPLARKMHHLHSRTGSTKERGQLSLALRQEPFQSLLAPTHHFHELPSPSSASLHSGHESLGIQELTTKSNSAPLLLKQEKKRSDDFAGQKLSLRYSRSQSDRYLAEIEAVEACKWLRAAGFPQYAQMYEDHQFPIDLTNVAKDHTNLENDQLQSLYRRLCILNRCANMRLDQSHKAQTPQQKEDSDDENFALSENWTFQPHIRRWSRIGEMGLEIPPAGKLNVEKTESSSKESSPDRFEDDAYDLNGAGLTLTLPGGTTAAGTAGTGDSTDTTLNDSATEVRLRRTGSERLKDGAKALLRRVESIKSRRRKRQNREGIVISGPQALELSHFGQRSSMRKPDAVYSTPPSPSAVSPMHTSFPKSPFFGNELKVPSQSENFLSPNRASPKRTPTTPRSMRTSPLHFFSNPMPHLKEGKSDDSSSYYSDSQESSTGGKLSLSLRKTPSKTRRFLQRTGKVDDIGAHSDSECHQGRKLLIKDANSNTTEIKIKKLTRGGSLNLGKDPKKRDGFRTASFRSRSTTRKDVKTEESDTVKHRTPVVRWHSFQMEERPHMIFRKCFSQKIDPNATDNGMSFAGMSAGQLQIIRKLALVILTGHMERYCPTHRSGWNWELPKFIKKIKMPDYKDKRVFGVPPLLILQRTGQTLPVAVRAAFRWLQLNALDQIGLFRKSGVKSRIIKLKELIEYSESSAECMEVFDTQQAYDVADMLKQYFRDLPESLLTTKMSETFAAIFQHLPPDVRLDAVQCAVLLLPDENREILLALLEFLALVAANSPYNQMTANNLAVCLAPSLFHSSISTGTASVTASPRRRKGAGVPDAKELSEAKASHECLAFMIDTYKHIYTASKEKIAKCNFGYMEESKPVPLEALGEGMQFHNWRGYLYECTSATIKEGREKTRGWFTITSQNDTSVEIAYKKVGDGHPLRLWRCITEVEGPPKDVMDYIIKQRASWDVNLVQSQTVKKLDERTEIFQYALDGQITSDFCVLRSWQTELPRGACVIVETSIDHAKAKPMFGAVRGVVLASRYLIEPCGSGRSRVMHLARVDIKGKTPEWYNKSYGHICSHYLSKIRLAFKNVADGPESKV